MPNRSIRCLISASLAGGNEKFLRSLGSTHRSSRLASGRASPASCWQINGCRRTCASAYANSIGVSASRFRTSMASSSRSSRSRACSAVSEGSTFPPGNSQKPGNGPSERRWQNQDSARSQNNSNGDINVLHAGGPWTFIKTSGNDLLLANGDDAIQT